ncbi:hypothetical protein [Pararobbsia alpina]|uniref:Uncharacterized protein n=1 Tax=Pararobbsia alpina TaxID=621374 RepID=A0A6S7BQ70_9BURK|nr:hypothetical protein [Pararobbsia alpina]CAB3809381.1 hypothetical protein LMG28138_06099 [Pararobbsia alpina]
MDIDKKLVEIAQGRYADPWLAETHSRARGGIKHPLGNNLDRTVTSVDMDDPTAAALLDVSNLDAVPKQRMPPILDFDFLPDMGRMNGQWPSAEKIGCSAARCERANARPRS